ncbi:MAG: hypothetical protein AAGC46_00600 [Solirubrobacteraceae bacterium]
MTIRTKAATYGGAALLALSAAPVMAQTASARAGQHHKAPAKNVVTARYTDAQLTTVATALGVSLDDLKAARTSVKATIASTDTRETPAQVNALLATALGGTITADQVTAAFASLKTASSTSGSSSYPSDSSGSYPSDASGHGSGGCDHGSSGNTSGSSPSDSSGSYPSDTSTSTSNA